MAELNARLTLTDDFSAQILKASESTNVFQNQIKATREAVEQMSKSKVNVMIMVKDDATESINRIKSKAEALVKSSFKFEIAAIDKTRSVISGITNSIFNLKTLAAGIILGGTGKAAYDWTIGNGISNENYLATLQTVMHDKGKGTEALKWAYKDAASTPFDAAQVVSGVTQLSTSGLDYTKYLNPLGDAAAAMNRPLEQAIFAMGKLKSGQFGMAVDMFRDFGISNQDWIKEGAKFSKNGEMQGVTIDKAVDMVTKIIQNKYGGLMEAKSNTAGGMLSNIGDSISGIGRGIAGIDGEGQIMKGGLFDNFKQQLQVVMPLLNKIQNSKAFSELQKDISDLTTSGGAKLTAFLKGFDDPKKITQYKSEFKQFIADAKAGVDVARDLGKAVGTIATTLKPVFTLVAAHPKLFLGLFAGFEAIKGGLVVVSTLKSIGQELQYLPTALGLFKLSAVSTFKTIVGFMLANPLPILAIIAAVALLYEAWIHDWGGIREKTHEVVAAIKKDWEDLKNFLAHPIDAIVNYSKQGDTMGLGVDSKAGVPIGKTTRMSGHTENALGTSYFKGGWSLVGEHGPELMKLPSGTSILDNRNSEKNLGGNVTIAKLADQIVVREDADIDKIATALASKINEHALNM